MSEYPVHCNRCGHYLGYVHATEYGLYVCDDCRKKIKKGTASPPIIEPSEFAKWDKEISDALNIKIKNA